MSPYRTNFWIRSAAAAAAAATKSLQSCPTLCDPIDGSPLGSPVPGILQARTLERVVISCSNAWKWKVKVKSLSRVRLLATPWTAAYQALLSKGFSRQEYWSGVPLPSLELGLVLPKTCLKKFRGKILMCILNKPRGVFIYVKIPLTDLKQENRLFAWIATM